MARATRRASRAISEHPGRRHVEAAEIEAGQRLCAAFDRHVLLVEHLFGGLEKCGERGAVAGCQDDRFEGALGAVAESRAAGGKRLDARQDVDLAAADAGDGADIEQGMRPWRRIWVMGP
jgi:hypothetical protein